MYYFYQMSKNTNFFSKKLIAWYLQNKRDLPWRKTKDPYKIWLSEIILQQTRVDQGLPYYNRFVATYPTVHHLANATQEEVLKHWQGLGYYSRARNLHSTACYISGNYNGVFPQTINELLALKGVGDYTASAVASICFNKPAAVVDGNVFRVLSRFFGIDTPINIPAGKKQFKSIAQKLIDTKKPGDYNQAIMEFGARFCVPVNPTCTACIFKNDCFAFINNNVKSLPVKEKKAKIKKRYFNYLVLISDDSKTMIKQRKKKDIWQNLYEFPLIETPAAVGLTALKRTKEFVDVTQTLSITSFLRFNKRPILHKLSHQELHTTFWILEIKKSNSNFIKIKDIDPYPVPVLIQKFINRFFLN